MNSSLNATSLALNMTAAPAVLDAYSVAARTWHAHKELGWIGGEVTSKNIDGETVVLEFRDEKEQVRVQLHFRRVLSSGSK